MERLRVLTLAIITVGGFLGFEFAYIMRLMSTNYVQKSKEISAKIFLIMTMLYIVLQAPIPLFMFPFAFIVLYFFTLSKKY